ncbi:hypothetical protein BJY01DRAFT_223985 [Aspergillus pseudoustus]|uniref:Uncharacterized protein n=1 Tax=Aspergillus pseudoustus TaxID=1810923 RepID=A0ABR4J4A1_9EURO
MLWSTEGILAFITLITSLPTCFIAVYTIINRRRGYRPYNPYRSYPSPQLGPSPDRADLVPVPGPDPHRWAFSMAPSRFRDPQSLAEDGLSLNYYELRFGSLEARRQIA